MQRKTSSAVLSLGGAAAAAIGAFLPWIDVRPPWVFSGVELPISVYYGRPFISDPPWLSPDPTVFMSAGALLIVVAIVGSSVALRWPWVAIGAAMLVMFAPVLVVMTIDREPEYFVPEDVGPGLIVVLIGGLACLAGGVVAWRDSHAESRRT